MEFPGGDERRVDRRDLVAMGDALYEAEAWRLLYDRARKSPAWRTYRGAQALPRRLRARGAAVPPSAAPVAGAPPAVLVVDREQPLWDRRAGALRTATLLHAFKAAGAAVTLGYLDPRRHEPYTSELERAGIGVVVGADRLRAFLAEQGGRLALVCLTWPDVAEPLLDAVRRTAPRALLAYDAIDLHHLRFSRQEAYTGVPAGAAQERERERRIAETVDAMLTVSDVEAELLRRDFGVRDVRTVPLLEAPRRGPVPGFAERRGMVFVGSFDHRPNLDGAIWLLDAVMPLLRGHPAAELTLVGQQPPPELVARAGEGVRVAGWVADVAAELDRHRVFVCPLPWGAGVKGKCVLALGNGLPLVSTSVGVEGMAVRDGVEALVRDDAEGFAEAILALHDDAAMWERMSAAGVAYVAERHSSDAVVRLAAALLADAARHRGS